MAVIADIVTERLQAYPQQYVNVYRVLVSKTSLVVEVGIYASEAEYRDGVPPHRLEPLPALPFDMNDPTALWAQAYVAIKAKWPHSTDC